MNKRKKEAQVSEDSLFMHLIGFDIVKAYPSSLLVLAVSQAPLQLLEVSHLFSFCRICCEFFLLTLSFLLKTKATNIYFSPKLETNRSL